MTYSILVSVTTHLLRLQISDSYLCYIFLLGINYDEGIPYEESNDMDATDENPDRGEV